MLVLSRRIGERIVIGDDIVIQITDIDFRAGKVKVGIDAPQGVRVDREEVRIAINRNKAKANDFIKAKND
jgi:carbon storage regulator